MCIEQEQQEHKPRSKNTKLKYKNHKPRNTNTDININLATELPCQPNTKATNTNPTTDFSCQPNTKTTNTNPNISKNTNNSGEPKSVCSSTFHIFSSHPPFPFLPSLEKPRFGTSLGIQSLYR